MEGALLWRAVASAPSCIQGLGAGPPGELADAAVVGGGLRSDSRQLCAPLCFPASRSSSLLCPLALPCRCAMGQRERFQALREILHPCLPAAAFVQCLPPRLGQQPPSFSSFASALLLLLLLQHSSLPLDLPSSCSCASSLLLPPPLVLVLALARPSCSFSCVSLPPHPPLYFASSSSSSLSPLDYPHLRPSLPSSSSCPWPPSRPDLRRHPQFARWTP